MNQHYPVADNNTIAPSVTPQGIFLRCWSNDANNKEEIVNQFTGSQTTTRFFRGAKAYKLASGQLIKFGNRANGTVSIQGANTPMFFQFAVSTDRAAINLPAGTVIGHFKIDFSITNTALTEDSAIFNFVTAANGKLQVKSADNNAVLKEIDCGIGYWTLLTFAEYPSVPAGSGSDPSRGNSTPFILWDSLQSKYKGLAPINAKIPPTSPVALADFNVFSAGIQCFADANTTVTTVRPGDMNPGWGLNDDAGTPADAFNTIVQGWELAAENNGVLYIDDISWNIGLFNDPNRLIDQEQAARMDDFNTVSTEPKEPLGPPIASAKSWDLY